MKAFKFLLILLCVYPALAFAVPEIHVLEHVNLRQGGEIKLGDITQFKGLKPSDQLQLSQIVLGDAPAIHEKRVFSSEAISQIFRTHVSRQSYPTIHLVIPSRVTVENKGYPLNKAEVAKTLLKQWSQLCRECRFSLSQLALPLIPARLSALPWKITPPHQLPRGAFSAQLTLEQESGRQHVYWLTGTVKIKKKVPVLRRTVAGGERLQQDDVQWQYRDVTFATDGIPEVTEYLNKKLRIGKNANDILWASDVERDKALHRGELVRLTVGGSAFKVSVMGIAEQDGYIGDWVKVKNRQTKKMIVGVVTDQGEVKVE